MLAGEVNSKADTSNLSMIEKSNLVKVEAERQKYLRE